MIDMETTTATIHTFLVNVEDVTGNPLGIVRQAIVQAADAEGAQAKVENAYRIAGKPAPRFRLVEMIAPSVIFWRS